MAESRSHKAAKRLGAGRTGVTESVYSDGRRVIRFDYETPSKIGEVETSGKPRALEYAAWKLSQVSGRKRELSVPVQDMDLAAEIADQFDPRIRIVNLKRRRRMWHAGT